MKSADRLYNYLKLKEVMNYEDLDNLCFSLFCTTDILPENLKSLRITKDVLAQTFMKLVIDKKKNEKSDKNYWTDLIDQSLILGKSPNLQKARTILGSE